MSPFDNNNTRNSSSADDNASTTTPCPEHQDEPQFFTVYVQFAAILALVVVTVTGNLLLLAIIFRSRQLRSTVSNALIVNLAIADSLVGVFVLPAFAATVLQGGAPASDAVPGLCSAFGVVAVVLSSESLLTLGAIAVDRYLNICHPLVYIRLAEPHKMALFITMTWVYSTVIGCIPLSAYDAYTYLGSSRLRICFIDFTATSGGSTFAALLLGAVVGPALLAVSVCYFQVFVTARVQAQDRKSVV